MLVKSILAGGLCLAAALFSGCEHSLGSLTAQSATLGNVQLQSNYQIGAYTLQENGLCTIVLIDGPEDNPTQVVTIRTIWTPWAGRTPIEPDATNATIHYTIFTGPEKKVVGVYSGAGYVFLHDNAGKAVVDFSLWQSNLILVDSTPGFKDLLGQSNMHGSFEVPRQDIRVQSLLKSIREQVSAKLGYPRQVMLPGQTDNKSQTL